MLPDISGTIRRTRLNGISTFSTLNIAFTSTVFVNPHVPIHILSTLQYSICQKSKARIKNPRVYGNAESIPANYID